MKKTKMLKKNYEFRKVLAKGNCFFGKDIVVFIQKNNKMSCNFLGLAISVKTCKAVGRNRIKRLIREAYFSFEEQITLGNNIVFLWNKKANPKEVSFKDIQRDIAIIFDKAKVLKNAEDINENNEKEKR